MVDWDKQFFERRQGGERPAAGRERRQFVDSHADLAPPVREFAQAVDSYKLAHGRKFITIAELYEIFAALGYHK